MRMEFTGLNQKVYTVDEKLSAGGEGTVYSLIETPLAVAKIYNDTIFKTPADRARKERKLKAMIKVDLASSQHDGFMLAWPEDLLYYHGQFAGFIMPKVNTEYQLYSIYRVGRTSTMLKAFPGYTWKYSCQMAYNLACAVANVHRYGMSVGDLNPKNIVVDTQQAGKITLIDCDSFDITDPNTGEHFPCEVGMEEVLAPEIQKHKYVKDGHFSEETDCFSLAILIFRLLMRNENPFASSPLNPNLEDNYLPKTAMLNGDCVYVKVVPGRTLPERVLNLAILPPKLRSLFARTFSYTREMVLSDGPFDRPTAAQWCSALYELAAPGEHANLKTCEHAHPHLVPDPKVYPAHLDHCPWCELEKRQEEFQTMIRARSAARLHSSKKGFPAYEKKEYQPSSDFFTTEKL